MTPLENMNARHLLGQIQKHIEAVISAPRDVKLEREEFGKSIDEYMEDLKDRRVIHDPFTAQVVTYTIHDIKNLCVVRLNDADGRKIKDLTLYGRRHAHRVGRQQLGNVYTEFQMCMPSKRIQFTVKLD